MCHRHISSRSTITKSEGLQANEEEGPVKKVGAPERKIASINPSERRFPTGRNSRPEGRGARGVRAAENPEIRRTWSLKGRCAPGRRSLDLAWEKLEPPRRRGRDGGEGERRGLEIVLAPLLTKTQCTRGLRFKKA